MTSYRLNPSVGKGVPIDPEILDLIEDLNSKGLKTFSSGSGSIPDDVPGFVTFAGLLSASDQEKALSIMQSHGLRVQRGRHWVEDARGSDVFGTGVKYREEDPLVTTLQGKRRTNIEFNPIGSRPNLASFAFDDADITQSPVRSRIPRARRKQVSPAGLGGTRA